MVKELHGPGWMKAEFAGQYRWMRSIHIAPLAWKNVNEKHIIDGAPALRGDSTLTCVLGGTISIIMSSSSVEANAPKTADEPDHVEAAAPSPPNRKTKAQPAPARFGRSTTLRRDRD